MTLDIEKIDKLEELCDEIANEIVNHVNHITETPQSNVDSPTDDWSSEEVAVSVLQALDCQLTPGQTRTVAAWIWYWANRTQR